MTSLYLVSPLYTTILRNYYILPYTYWSSEGGPTQLIQSSGVYTVYISEYCSGSMLHTIHQHLHYNITTLSSDYLLE